MVLQLSLNFKLPIAISSFSETEKAEISKIGQKPKTSFRTTLILHPDLDHWLSYQVDGMTRT